MKLILIILSLTLSFCKSDIENIVAYYPNGNIKEIHRIEDSIKKTFIYDINGSLKSECTLNNDLKNGTEVFYDRNKGLEYTLEWKNGFKEGDSVYYKNGNVVSKYSYKRNLLSGYFYEYTQSGKLYKKGEYFSFGGSTELNRVIYYNQYGIDTARSNYFEVTYDQNKILLGDTFFINLAVIPMEDLPNLKITLSKRDYLGKLLDSTNFETFESKNMNVDCYYIPNKLGLDTVRGVINNYKKVNDSTYASRFMFFSTPINVIPKRQIIPR